MHTQEATYRSSPNPAIIHRRQKQVFTRPSYYTQEANTSLRQTQLLYTGGKHRSSPDPAIIHRRQTHVITRPSMFKFYLINFSVCINIIILLILWRHGHKYAFTILTIITWANVDHFSMLPVKWNRQCHLVWIWSCKHSLTGSSSKCRLVFLKGFFIWDFN